MNILCINFGHDASLALFFDGELVQFEELERSSRLKHQYGLTSPQIHRFLERKKTSLEAIDLVALCGTQHWLMPHGEDIVINLLAGPATDASTFGKFSFGPKMATRGTFVGGRYRGHLEQQGIDTGTPALVATELHHRYLRGFDFTSEELKSAFDALMALSEEEVRGRQQEFFIPGTIRIGGTLLPAFLVDHHFCHANYAYFHSQSRRSIIATHDGGLPVSPFNTGGIYVADERGVIPLVNHGLMLGCLYMELAGCASLNYDCGKLMGLAAYAIPDAASVSLARDLVEMADIRHEKSYDHGKTIALANAMLSSAAKRLLTRDSEIAKFSFSDKITPQAIQAAANLQFVVETVFTSTVGATASLLSNLDSSYANLNLTGGFTLNCPTNTFLKARFNNFGVHPMPGCGDTGISIGAGVAAYTVLGREVVFNQTEDMSAAFPPLEPEETENEDCAGYGLRKIDPGMSIPAFIAREIVQNKVLCLFRGRSEVGPRALGRRSIIGCATSGALRDRINKAKGREPWRPLAPMVRMEDFHDFFEGDPMDSRFMLFTCRVKDSRLEGVTHVDGSARVQGVSAQDPWIHESLGLIRELGQIPVIINTSFNCSDEPIVETISHAFRSFSRMGFDYLVTDRGVFAAAS